MPNRQLKESICTSESLALVSAEAERLFYRIIVNADDYGRYHGNPKVILAECFPLRIGDFAPKDIEAWLTELERVGMIRRYATDKRRFLHIVSWREHNTPRAKTSKYPSPDDCTHTNLQTSANICKQTHENALEVDNEVDAAPTGVSLDDLNPLEDEVANLKGWGTFTQDDRGWLEELVRDYPGVLPADIHDCRDYWLAKAKAHTKKQWKSRLRNWLSHKVTWRKDGDNQNSRRRADESRVYDPTPTYDRPLTTA